MTYPLSPATPSLYEQDYCLWLDRTIPHIQTGESDRLDIRTLIEELQGMSNTKSCLNSREK